ncbi:uracil-DNA glycosylase family protein [Mesorhizobium sp. CGMCC 1.15528]|uniref:Uracil-DNA glycosylase family protein n=1 Tax=Mesorhizobium zhangyense TaxID=1776730 RepID=A0A7C9R4S8_9HYPH|nr:uracil-DNA glycosylase family protein [Mesorhizobium zhangyense]NGN39538.1 uracil-DNA glycosylase family protein [Mesorhizobium zhangyense]
MPAELDRLVAEIRACRICVEQPLARPLPHEPRPVVVASTSARVLIAGQAPGTKVHASGLPFDDRSGDRLRDWLGVTRAQFYDAQNFAIVPMGFCFPGQDAKGGDLPPRRECAPAWRQRLIDLMPQVDLVLAVGLYAQSWHLGVARKESLNETVRDWRAIHDASTMPRVIPLPHPSWRNTGWLKKNPWFEMELLPVLKSEIRHRIS